MNVENASYGLTICAERVAIFKAVSEGHTKIEKIAIVSSSGEFTYPCGACRQVLNEFAGSATVILANNRGDIKTTTVKELLPHSFGPGDLA
ncbi:Cytidine deaminase [hydrothermal vent metagenome]|uniref:Cytidine deaminase n=1 Tax=hydrothermal vent metagenome TaxID=652676 RepID=A0A3B1CP29_9ZZZZ